LNQEHKPFDVFWKSYPKKVGKDAAETAWNRKVKTAETVTEIMQALETQTTSEAWTKEEGRFIPNPATWINQGRWKDETESSARSAFAGGI